MTYFIDIFALLLALMMTWIIYVLYYRIFVTGYIRKVKISIQNGEIKKAEELKKDALKKQPKRMIRLFNKYGIK